jgi:serine phosphatase RsbU (regulator of sigma subunit)
MLREATTHEEPVADDAAHEVGPTAPLPRRVHVLRTIVVAVVAVVLVLDVATVLAAVQRYRSERETAIAALRADADTAAAMLDAIVASAFDQLDAAATAEQFASADPERILDMLGQLDGPSAGFTGGYAWVDADGRARVVSGPVQAIVDVSVADRQHIRNALAGQRSVSQGLVSRVLDRPVVVFAVPTRDRSGGVNGALAGSVLLERTGRALGAVSVGDERLLVDRTGQIIVDQSDRIETLTAPRDDWPLSRYAEGRVASDVVDPAGRAGRLVTWAPVPSAGWTLVMSVDASTALGPATDDLVLALFVIALLSLLVVLGAVVLGHRLERHYRDSRLLADEAEAERAQAAAISEAMAQIAAAESLQAVGRTVASVGLPAFGARAAGMSVRDPERPEELVNLASEGWDDSLRQDWRRYPIDPELPVGDAVRRADAVFVTADELPDRYPAAANVMLDTGDAAWAAVPLLDGPRSIGVLSAAFESVDALDERTRLRLGLFAERVSSALVRVSRHEVEHQLAVEFQRAVLPTRMPALEGVQLEGLYRPASAAVGVGGDWYDAVRIDDHRLLVLCGDIVGHGLSAAAAASRLRTATAALALTHRPAELLEALDEVADRDDGARCSSLACLLIDTRHRSIEYSIAGHPPPLLLSLDRRPVELCGGRGLLLGLTRDTRPTAHVDMTDDITALVLYTDGLIERRGERYDVGVARLIDACDGDDDRPLTAVRIAEQLAEGARIDDDVTIVMVHLEPTDRPPPPPSTTCSGDRGR